MIAPIALFVLAVLGGRAAAAALCPVGTSAWAGTIVSRAVTCCATPIGSGAVMVVDTERLKCRGASRRAFVVSARVSDRMGTITASGMGCRQGPRPGRT
jgi:hypothetical protein